MVLQLFCDDGFGFLGFFGFYNGFSFFRIASSQVASPQDGTCCHIAIHEIPCRLLARTTGLDNEEATWRHTCIDVNNCPMHAMVAHGPFS